MSKRTPPRARVKLTETDRRALAAMREAVGDRVPGLVEAAEWGMRVFAQRRKRKRRA